MTLCIGVGNLYRSDDGVGVVVARRLRALALPNLQVAEANGAELLDIWAHEHDVILVDAVCAGGKPGTIYRLDGSVLPADYFRYSSHMFSIVEAVELARVLHRLPEHVMVYGVQAETFAPGEGLSPAVETAADCLVEEIRETLCMNSQ